MKEKNNGIIKSPKNLKNIQNIKKEGKKLPALKKDSEKINPSKKRKKLDKKKPIKREQKKEKIILLKLNKTVRKYLRKMSEKTLTFE